MTLDEIRKASAEQFAAERLDRGIISETTPPQLTPAIVAFAETLKASPPAFIPVVADNCGLYGWCSDGVRQKVARDGGQPVFGWTLWEWPGVLVTAEFHCVWRDPSGMLLDITPKPNDEAQILFVADDDFPENFDFDQRPRNRRVRLHIADDPSEKIRNMKRSMTNGKLSYETGRAAKAGLSIDSWLATKIAPDPVAEIIDKVIEACNQFEEHFDALGGAGEVRVDQKFVYLAKRRVELQGELKRLLKRT